MVRSVGVESRCLFSLFFLFIFYFLCFFSEARTRGSQVASGAEMQQLQSETWRQGERGWLEGNGGWWKRAQAALWMRAILLFNSTTDSCCLVVAVAVAAALVVSQVFYNYKNTHLFVGN